MKYRIKEVILSDGSKYFVPEHQFWFWWVEWCEGMECASRTVMFDTLREAENFLTKESKHVVKTIEHNY